MIDTHQIKAFVINPTLEKLGMYSPEASELVFNTGLVESDYKYIAQIGGPARSFWQVEPTTMRDIFENYLFYRSDVLKAVNSIGSVDKDFQLATNMAFGAAMCRLKYRRSSMPLPAVGDIPGQAHIWKQAYNTPLGAGTEEKFIETVEKYNATHPAKLGA